MSIGRVILAILAGFLTLWLMLNVAGIGSGLVWSLLDKATPTVSATTQNVNTGDWGSLLLLPLALAAAFVCGAIIIDPGMSAKSESITALVVFILLGSVSGVNFWSHDALLNVYGQALIDIVLSISAIVVIVTLLRWKPAYVTTLALQRIALFLVTVFGFAIPLYFATCLLLIKVGFMPPPEPGKTAVNALGLVNGLVGFTSAVLGLVTALTPTFLKMMKRRRT
ncbi:hypothetical protein GFM13_37460 [Rhizobium leguminosarum bv. viciae]|nr:hypothetical protein [Rhizobium leguminosarum bv. viciae]